MVRRRTIACYVEAALLGVFAAGCERRLQALASKPEEPTAPASTRDNRKASLDEITGQGEAFIGKTKEEIIELLGEPLQVARNLPYSVPKFESQQDLWEFWESYVSECLTYDSFHLLVNGHGKVIGYRPR